MGYRLHGSAQHVSAIRFVETVLSEDVADIIIAFERMRRKRHIAVYGTVGLISKQEAKNALRRAEKFLDIIRSALQNHGFLETKNSVVESGSGE